MSSYVKYHLKMHKKYTGFCRFLLFTTVSIENSQFLRISMTFDHLKTNSAKLAQCRLKILNVTESSLSVLDATSPLTFSEWHIVIRPCLPCSLGGQGAPLVYCYKAMFTVQSGGHLSEKVTGVRRLLSPIFRTFSPTQVAFFKFFVHFNPIVPGGQNTPPPVFPPPSQNSSRYQAETF